MAADDRSTEDEQQRSGQQENSRERAGEQSSEAGDQTREDQGGKGRSSAGGDGGGSGGGGGSDSGKGRSSAGGDGGGSGGGGDSGSSQGKGSKGGRRRGGPKGLELINYARRIFVSATGRVPESVTGLRREDDGWVVSMDVVELERIPSSSDVMGEYLVRLSADGEFLGYERASRYIRSQPSAREQG